MNGDESENENISHPKGRPREELNFHINGRRGQLFSNAKMSEYSGLPIFTDFSRLPTSENPLGSLGVDGVSFLNG